MPQPAPPLIVEAFATNAPNSSPSAPVAGGKTNPFPAASQIGITDGAASLFDGFPPLNMTPLAEGGVAPFGVDANGILYLLSAHIAAIAAGQLYPFSMTLAVAMGGYGIGAEVYQLADPTARWISIGANNSNNPDTASPLGSNGWISSKPLYDSVTAGGNDIALLGGSDYIYDVDATAGAINITGFVPLRDGQTLTIRKKDNSGNAVTLQSLTGSAVGHQLQIIAAGIPLTSQYQMATIQFNSTVDAWVQIG